jgi:hypothetical protein
MISAVAKDLNPNIGRMRGGRETGRSGLGVAKYRRLPHPNSIFTITKQAKNDMMNGILNALWFETRST